MSGVWPSPISDFFFNSSVGLKSQQLQLDWKWMVSYVTNQDAPTHSLFRVQSSTTIGKQPKLYSLPSHMSSHYIICLSWPRLLHSKCRFSQSFAVEKPECFPRAWSMDPSAVWPLDCYSSRCCQAWSLASGAMYNRVPPMKFANLNNGWDFHLQLTFIHDSSCFTEGAVEQQTRLFAILITIPRM